MDVREEMEATVVSFESFVGVVGSSFELVFCSVDFLGLR